jgi:hypothetical protein
MKRQLAMFDNTYLLLCKSVRDAEKGLERAQKLHRGQQHARLILEACRRAQLKYELRSKARIERKAA